MITEKDLLEAIAECQGTRDPKANTCIKLASYYTILDHISKKEEEPETPVYSFASQPDIVNYYGESEFAKIIEGRDSDEVWEVMDELMSTLQVVNPRLYASVMRKLEG